MAIFDKIKFSALLETKFIAKTLVYTDTTGSTMDDAPRLAHQVAEYPNGTALLSERQTKARGARDHKWDATNTQNIYVSFILHLPPHYKTFEGRFDIEVAACLAVTQVACKFGVTAATPKWPNDVWVRGHKLAGFLVEDGNFNIPGSLNCLIILGMGINVNSDVRRGPELSGIATSLRCELGGRPVDREQFFAEVCALLEHNLDQSRATNLEVFKQENLYRTGQEISVSCPAEGRVIDATFLEICDNWDVRFSDKSNETFQGRSDQYTVRPKVVNKILVIFTTVLSNHGDNVLGKDDGDAGRGDDCGRESRGTGSAAQLQMPVSTRLAQRLASLLQALVDTSRYVVCLVPESLITDTDDWMKTCSLLILPEPLANPGQVSSKLDTFLVSRGGRVLSSGLVSLFMAKWLHIPYKEVLLHPSETHPEFCLVQVKANLLTLPQDPMLCTLDKPITSTVGSEVSQESIRTVSPGREDSRKFSQTTRIIFPTSSSSCFQFFENEHAMLAESCATSQDNKGEATLDSSGDVNLQCSNQGGISKERDIRSGERLPSPHHKTTVWAVYDERDSNLSTPSIAACVVQLDTNDQSCAALVGFDIGEDFSSPPCAASSQSSEEMDKLSEERFKRDTFLQQIVDFLLHP